MGVSSASWQAFAGGVAAARPDRQLANANRTSGEPPQAPSGLCPAPTTSAPVGVNRAQPPSRPGNRKNGTDVLMTGHMTARSWRIRALVRVRRGRSARADGAEPVRAAAGRVRSESPPGARELRGLVDATGHLGTASARGRRLASYLRAPNSGLCKRVGEHDGILDCLRGALSSARGGPVRVADEYEATGAPAGQGLEVIDIVSQDHALVSCLGHLRDRLVPAGEAPQDLRLPALRVVRLSLGAFLVANQYVRPRPMSNEAEAPQATQSGGRAPATPRRRLARPCSRRSGPAPR